MSINDKKSKNSILNIKTEDIDFNKYNNKTKKTFIEKITNFRMLPMTILIVFVLGGSFYSSLKYGYDLDKISQKVAHIATLRQLSERIEKSALQARSGSQEAFNELKYSENNIDKLLNVLQNGGRINNVDNNIDKMKPEFSLQFNKVTKEWSENKPLIDALIAQEKNLISLKDNVTIEKNNIQSLIENSSNFQKLVEKLSPKDNTYAQELFLLSNRINQGLTNLFAGESFSLENGYILVKDLRVFSNILDMFENGSNVYGVEKVSNEVLLSSIQDIKKIFNPFKDLTDQIVSQVATLNNAKDVALQVSNASKDLVATAGELNQAFTSELNTLSIYRSLAIALQVISAALLALMILAFSQKEKQAKQASKALFKNQNNQDAVTQLLKQIEPMDSGDFTKKVSISDKFVTQIAEKVDNTREVFSGIVKQIKTTSASILQNANSTDNSSKELLGVSDKQSVQLLSSIDKIGHVTSEMDEVAQTTWIAQEEANQSKEASQVGEKLVSKSIEKMDTIKNNIQESSKKIKKSSESAQAISEVTGLIQNITKQIEILAFNAAIQAASSGEAGKEFTIVAQEVQRLAVDSKKATHQILELIKEVQTDIAGAVFSMEKTTQEVVEGSKLTDDAGQALKRIEVLSQQVAQRVAEASNKLEEKSSDMVKIALDMKDLQSTTEKSKEILAITASEVEDLKRISILLNNIVKVYKVEK